MRILFRSAISLTVFAILFFASGCGEDTPGGGGVTLNPVVTLNSGAGLVSFNQDIDLNAPSFIVSVSGQDGDAPLRDLVIERDGLRVPTSELFFRTGETANNPIATGGTDANGFTYEIEITPANPVAGETTYNFILTDTDGEVGTTSVTINYVVTGPTVELVAGDGRVSEDATITGRTPVLNFRVNAARTADDLASISILEDGVLLPADQITVNGGNVDAENPLRVAVGEEAAASYDFDVRPAVSESGTRTYTIRATDISGVSTDQQVTITFDVPPGTPLSFTMMGAFFNASGGMLGGLDLDSGNAVAFNSMSAEIEDEGINLNAAVGTENWRGQVSATNDAVLRIANLSVLGENITFDDVTAVEDIEAVFEQGTTPAGSDDFPDADGDTSDTETVTEQLNDGDVLVVRRGDRTYLVRIDAVNFVAGSNDDGYTVSIKY